VRELWEAKGLDGYFPCLPELWEGVLSTVCDHPRSCPTEVPSLQVQPQESVVDSKGRRGQMLYWMSSLLRCGIAAMGSGLYFWCPLR